MDKVKIIFLSGLILEAMLNASTYITDEKPDFPSDLSEVTVEKDGEKTVYRNAEIMEAYSDDGKYHFGIREFDPDVIAMEKLDAQVTYTALMTDTVIDD